MASLTLGSCAYVELWEWVRKTERTVTKEFGMLGRDEAEGSWRNCGGKERNK